MELDKYHALIVLANTNLPPNLGRLTVLYYGHLITHGPVSSLTIAQRAAYNRYSAAHFREYIRHVIGRASDYRIGTLP